MQHILRFFPKDDGELNAYVEACELELIGQASLDAESLERLVQRRYPAARVHEQSRLGSVGGPVLWYVYRDGSLVGQTA